jgi:hypothetical protein
MADPTWKIAGALTLAHSLATAQPVSAPVPPASAPASDAYVCSVIMMNNKDVRAATVFNPATKEVLYTSTSMQTIENGHKAGPAKDGKGADAGTLKVGIHPESEDNTISRRPLTCSVGNETYTVKIPDNIHRRLFMH